MSLPTIRIFCTRLKLEIATDYKFCPKFVFYRSFEEFSVDSFHRDLDLSCSVYIFRTNNIYEKVDMLNSVLVGLFDNHTP